MLADLDRASPRTAIVVGGTGGIGRAIAADLARRQPTRLLLVYAADDEAARSALDGLPASDCPVSALRADVTTEQGLAALDAAVVEELGGQVNVFVYSAAHRVVAHALERTPAEWQRSLDVTVTGFVDAVQVLSPRFPRGGRILAVSGLSGVRAVSDVHMAMGVAKAALQHAVGYLALALAERDVNVNCLCLGSVRTEGVAADLSPADYERFVTQVARRNLKRRLPDPELVAYVAGFLCSPEAEWVDGQVVVADGGESVR